MDLEKVYARLGYEIDRNVIRGIPKPYCMKTRNIGRVVLDVPSENPDHVAQIEAETGKRTVRGETREASVRCALWLHERGIGCNDVISICIDNELDAYVPQLACYYTWELLIIPGITGSACNRLDI
ncbi:hypothetical protein TKK_0000735 [Trichogramma kaykai]